jgi:hypothetical protein
MFRFTIRDVLWLMMVVGLTLGWVLREQMDYARYHFGDFITESLETIPAVDWSVTEEPIPCGGSQSAGVGNAKNTPRNR